MGNYVRISIFLMHGKRKQVGGLFMIPMYLVISEILKGGVCINFPCPIRLKYAEEKVEARRMNYHCGSLSWLLHSLDH